VQKSRWSPIPRRASERLAHIRESGEHRVCNVERRSWYLKEGKPSRLFFSRSKLLVTLEPTGGIDSDKLFGRGKFFLEKDAREIDAAILKRRMLTKEIDLNCFPRASIVLCPDDFEWNWQAKGREQF
jgi:hypothetical protein